MTGLVDAFWRAAAYCLHPRVILWSVAPVLLAGLLVGGLAWWQGAAVVAAVRATLEGWAWTQWLLGWFQGVGLGGVSDLLAPAIVLALAVPLLVVLALLLVALLMTPAIVALVVSRRFPALERREGAAWWQVWAWSLLSTVIALAVLALSLPLWLLPPVALVLPPLIWGWLTYRVFAFEVLAVHASATERRQILARHRAPLLAMGVIAGYMGAAPTLIWAASAVTVVLAPVLLVVSVWLYTLVFAFAAAWFAHYTLAALQALREAERAAMPVVDAGPAPQPALPATPLEDAGATVAGTAPGDAGSSAPPSGDAPAPPRLP